MRRLNKTPQEIRREKQAERARRLTADLKYKIRLQAAFMARPTEEVELIRTMLLAELGYNPGIPMRENDWDVRVVYHADRLKLSRNQKVMEFFAKYLEEYGAIGSPTPEIY